MYCACSETMPRPARQRGFTLLELVLVLFILAILTTTSLSFIENEDGQLRYDESIGKLERIGTALFNERTHKNSAFFTGFVPDNGTLPPTSDLEPLTAPDTAWSDVGGNEWIGFDAQIPFYYNENIPGKQQLANEPRFTLFKGFRGRYLNTGLDANGNFLDGWGEPFLVAVNGNDFDYTFDGANSTKPPPFDSEITRTLAEIDWTVAPAILNIVIENNSGAEIAADSYEVAVAVFVNNAVANDADRWRTLHFTQNAAIPDGATFHSSAATWELDDTGTTTERIPSGEHLVLLVDRSVSPTINSDEVIDSTRFTVFPDAANQPEIRLTVP